MEVLEIAPGLWRWTTRHPEWVPEEDWEPEVGCVYYEGPATVFLIDPLVPTEEDESVRFWRALDDDVERADAPLAVLLTVHWHERSSDEVADRYGTSVWRRESGAPLPPGVEAIEVPRADETVFWIPEHRAIVPGDVLLGVGDGGIRLCPDSWLPKGSREPVRAALRPLLDLPVERVLVSHGQPVLSGGRDALAAALG